ncbi:MAG: exonuclease domain-containing protein [Limnospira sp.]
MQGYHQTPSDFVVLDTEGNDTLTEVGIVGDRGEVCYHAFVKGKHREPRFRLNAEPLSTIVEAIAAYCQDKVIVCHHAEHDDRILRRSFERVGIPYPDFQFICTWKLAQQQLPNLHSYSLSYLCKSLDVRSQGQRFDTRQAHSADYDAQFTYQLYRYLYTLQPPTMSQTLAELYNNTPNPFSSIRVNTPFEDHPDYPNIYSTEFDRLKNILRDIKADPNHQSQGAIVLGEPGSGKTHLMMRLAREVLRTNRLFFISHQPSEGVFYYSYSRILESFSEQIESTQLTQLEQLLARSFVNILSQTDWVNNDRGMQIINSLKDDSLSLYRRVGVPGTQKYHNNWNIIERKILEWWKEKYQFSTEYSHKVLKGIIRFCRYTEPNRKEMIRRWLTGNIESSENLELVGLTPWQDDLRDDAVFALEAIKTFGKLSILDEPLILIFDQLESLFEEQKRPILQSFGATVREILTQVPNSLIILNLFPDRWQRFQELFDRSVTERVSQSRLTLTHPSTQQLRQLLTTLCQTKIEPDSPHPSIDLDILCTQTELEEILSQPSIRSVIQRASDYFRYKVQGTPLPPLSTESAPLSVDLKSLKKRFEELYQAMGEAIKVFDKIALSEPLPELDDLDLDDGPKITSQPMPKVEPQSVSKTNIIELLLEEYWSKVLKDWETRYEKPRIISDEEDIGKLRDIISVFSDRYNIAIEQLSFGGKKLPEHLCITTRKESHTLAFLNRSGSSFTFRIGNFNQLVSYHKKIQFRLMRDIQEPEITGKGGKNEIEKLKATHNGEYVDIDRNDRIQFECIYQLIEDHRNRELDRSITLADIVDWMTRNLSDYWLIQCLTQ